MTEESGKDALAVVLADGVDAETEQNPETITVNEEQVSSEAKNSGGYPELSLTEDVRVTYSDDDSDEKLLCQFSPEEDGYYTIYSYDADNDPYLCYYGTDINSSPEFSKYNGNDPDFSLTAPMESGKTYYFKFDGYGLYSVHIQKTDVLSLTEAQSVSLVGEDDTRFYKFIPQTTGYYQMTVSSDSDIDPEIKMYDKDLQWTDTQYYYTDVSNWNLLLTAEVPVYFYLLRSICGFAGCKCHYTSCECG